MYSKLVLAALFAIMASCKKEKDEVETPPVGQKPAIELLTQKEWILASHGFDDNDNKVIDQSENLIQDCQKDNSYIFTLAGTGSSHDNAIVCGAPGDSNFQWKLKDADKKLEIGFETISIFRLNENEMILSPELPGLAVSYVLTYRH